MTAANGVSAGAGAVVIGSNGSTTARVSAPQDTRPTTVADLEARYRDILTRLKDVQYKAQSVSSRQPDKWRSLLEEAAKLRTSFRDLRRYNDELFNRPSTTAAEANRLSELAAYHFPLGQNLDNAQATLASRAAKGVGERLTRLERDVASFAASRKGPGATERKKALEARLAQARRDIVLVEGALDGLRGSASSVINDFAEIVAQSVDEQRAQATEIEFRLSR